MKAKFIPLIVIFLVPIFIGMVIALKGNSQTHPKEEFSITAAPTSENTERKETVDEIGLSFTHPTDLVFRKEIADDGANIRTAGFFLTKGSENNPDYQMYGLYEQYKDATSQDLERAKTEMDPNSIKEASIDGYKGIEGLIVGPKTRYITIVLQGNKLFSVSTLPPTLPNKELTDKIITTFDFK